MNEDLVILLFIIGVYTVSIEIILASAGYLTYRIHARITKKTTGQPTRRWPIALSLVTLVIGITCLYVITLITSF